MNAEFGIRNAELIGWLGERNPASRRARCAP